MSKTADSIVVGPTTVLVTRPNGSPIRTAPDSIAWGIVAAIPYKIGPGIEAGAKVWFHATHAVRLKNAQEVNQAVDRCNVYVVPLGCVLVGVNPPEVVQNG